MKQNEKLAQILADALEIAEPPAGHEASPETAKRLARMCLALNEWLSAGGELPFSWQGARKP